MKIISSVDLSGQELTQARLHNLDAAPLNPALGLVYYDTPASSFYGWNGNEWKRLDNIDVGVSTDDTSTAPQPNKVPRAYGTAYIDQGWLPTTIQRSAPVTAHVARIAGIGSTGTLGHVRLDGDTILIDANGVIRAVASAVADASVTPLADKIPRAPGASVFINDGWLSGSIARIADITAHAAFTASQVQRGHIRIDSTTLSMIGTTDVLEAPLLKTVTSLAAPSKLVQSRPSGYIDDNWLSPSIARSGLFENHIQQIASATVLGHIKIDNDTLKIGSGLDTDAIERTLYVAGSVEALAHKIVKSNAGGVISDGYISGNILRATHAVLVAAPSVLGHVRPDGVTIIANASGILSAIGAAALDASEVPGPYLVPKAGADSRIVAGWLPDSVVFQTELDTHAAVKATVGALGHIRPDGTTIVVDAAGIISAVSATSLEATTTPTPNRVPLAYASGTLDAGWLPGIAVLQPELDTHAATRATTVSAGHVLPDNDTIIITGADKIAVNAASAPVAFKFPRALSTGKIHDDWLSDTFLRTPHAAQKASTTVLGHVKVDGTTVQISTDGTLSAYSNIAIEASTVPAPSAIPRSLATNFLDDGWLSPLIMRRAEYLTHVAQKATPTTLGHVRADNVTILVDANGVLRAGALGSGVVDPTPNKTPISPNYASGRLKAGWITQHVQANALPADEQLTIPAASHMLVYGAYAVEGVLNIEGSFVLQIGDDL